MEGIALLVLELYLACMHLASQGAEVNRHYARSVLRREHDE